MASVTIYPEHRDILDALISSGKVKSVAGATKTGPFIDQRDAYVFAASLAMALGRPCEESELPKSRKDVTTIRDSVFLGADGAEELSCASVFLTEEVDESLEKGIGGQLQLISEELLHERFAILDRYAYAGFEWLRTHQKDESSVRELILTALNEIESAKVGKDASEATRDPLLDVLFD